MSPLMMLVMVMKSALPSGTKKGEVAPGATGPQRGAKGEPGAKVGGGVGGGTGVGGGRHAPLGPHSVVFGQQKPWFPIMQHWDVELSQHVPYVWYELPPQQMLPARQQKALLEKLGPPPPQQLSPRPHVVLARKCSQHCTFEGS